MNILVMLSSGVYCSWDTRISEWLMATGMLGEAKSERQHSYLAVDDGVDDTSGDGPVDEG